jgi:hypothetical protein
VHFDGDDWAREAVLLERRCELSAVLGLARPGALRRVHDAVHVLVRSGASGRVCMRERARRSQRPRASSSTCSEARAWPMGGLGGRGRLGELGGGEWDLVAQWWTVASPRSFVATGVCPGHAGE